MLQTLLFYQKYSTIPSNTLALLVIPDLKLSDRGLFSGKDFQFVSLAMAQHLIPAEIQPLPNRSKQAALSLQRLGFQILYIGQTISVQAPRQLWESTFHVSFQPQQKTMMAEIENEVTYLTADTNHLILPEELQGLIAEVMFVEPPEFLP